MNQPVNPHRRRLIAGTVAVAAGAWAVHRLRLPLAADAQAAPAETPMAVRHSDAEWKQQLSPEQYRVLREEGTERPFTSPLNDEHRAGIFTCAGCAQDLFDARTKFDSKTGWPSFYQPLPQAVGERRDGSFGMTRTEIHCSRCGGHLGHVFDDGPPPTGLRYCMNGVAMGFKPA